MKNKILPLFGLLGLIFMAIFYFGVKPEYKKIAYKTSQMKVIPAGIPAALAYDYKLEDSTVVTLTNFHPKGDSVAFFHLLGKRLKVSE